MTVQSTHTLSCPKCAASYQVRSGFQGKVRCRGCGATFTVGAGSRGGGGKQGRRQDMRDQKTATRVLVVVALVVVLFGGLVAVLNTSEAPGGQEGRSVAIGDVDASDPDVYRIEDRAPEVAAERPEATPEIKAVQDQVMMAFLEALAEGDEEAFDRHFNYRLYWKELARDAGWEPGDDYHYASANAEKREELEALARDTVMGRDMEVVEGIRTLLLPGLRSGEIQPYNVEREIDFASFDLTAKDEQGEDYFSLRLRLRLNEGLDPRVDGLNPESWGVYTFELRRHKSTLAIREADTSHVDLVSQRIKEERREARRRSVQTGKGPAEADPERVDPLPGTSGAQASRIQSAVRILTDRGSSGPEVHEAHQALIRYGKVSIPFLLNALVGKDHRMNEDDILSCMPVITTLREITGNRFGYGPPNPEAQGLGMGQGGLAGATPDQRLTALKRWFGWWKAEGPTWSGRKDENEKEEDGSR